MRFVSGGEMRHISDSEKVLKKFERCKIIPLCLVSSVWLLGFELYIYSDIDANFTLLAMLSAY